MPEPPQPIVARSLGVDRNIDRRAIRARVVAPPTLSSCPVQMRLAGRCRTRRRSTVPRGRCYCRLPCDKHYLDARGLFRVFNAAEYRFYRSQVAPPVEGSTAPYATGSTLPFTADDTFDDGTWYLSMSYFNGVIDSGFLPLGAGGETYVRLDIQSGAVVGSPPAGPLQWRLEAAAAGVVRVIGFYYEDGLTRADQWSIAYTADGGDPPADAPDYTEDIPAAGLAVLSFDLPAAADGATVKVRLQTRRNDGSDAEPVWVYSDSEVKSIAADAAGPAAPPVADRWPGPLPVDEGF